MALRNKRRHDAIQERDNKRRDAYSGSENRRRFDPGTSGPRKSKKQRYENALVIDLDNGQRSDYNFSTFDDADASQASTGQLSPKASTEIPINSTTYYNPEPNQAISEFIDSVVNLPVHPEDDPLHPVEEMQE